ncbi:MAG: ribonuclease D [Rhodospirillaceae bacterium]|nr:ribonuclease D [Rhodospirillaceae bacterium]|tara:strand:+ start:115 stop:726 length:612 start_codon:yes stop_codon:yes gene_type:complete
MNIYLHENDLPKDLKFSGTIAVDTETTGLNLKRDRLCLVQLSSGDGSAHLIRFSNQGYAAPNLSALLQNPDSEKIFHFARFDVAVLFEHLRVWCEPVYCTKIASKIARTYTDRHGLKDLCRELLGQDLSKAQQSSDWGAEILSAEQKAYAAHDVLHLHELRKQLNLMLEREGRKSLALECFSFIKTRAKLDLAGWGASDIFSH